MTDKLTHEDVAVLSDFFTADEHKIRYDGYAYIDEYALRPRLNAVDPAWGFSIDEISVRQGADQLQVSVRGTMTIRGVSRSGVGMSETTGIFTTGKKKGKKYDKEAEKNAATDCLRRCARLFGVGAYLLRAPEFKKAADLQNWLNSQAPVRPAAPENWILDNERYEKFVAWCVDIVGIEEGEIPTALNVDMRSDYHGTPDMAQAQVIAYAGDYDSAAVDEVLSEVYIDGDKAAQIGKLIEKILALPHGGNDNGKERKDTVVDGAKFMMRKGGKNDYTVLLDGDKDAGIILWTRDPLRKVSKTMAVYVDGWKHGKTYRFAQFGAPLIVSHTGNDIHSIRQDIPI